MCTFHFINYHTLFFVLQTLGSTVIQKAAENKEQKDVENLGRCHILFFIVW